MALAVSRNAGTWSNDELEETAHRDGFRPVSMGACVAVPVALIQNDGKAGRTLHRAAVAGRPGFSPPSDKRLARGR
jgi:hypothetical protein